jgi:UDP-N-acetyl-2-amino-2-deoxyglucuronate dehydrogenase
VSRAAGDRPLRLAIVGCGGAALDVARAIDAAAGTVLVAVHDRIAARAEAVARPRGAAIHPTLSGLLRDDGIDAVYVALPHDRLAPTAAAALRAGRHVLVEKPLAIRPAQVRTLSALAARRDLAVGVMFELRHVPTVAEASRLIRAGEIGPVRSIRIRTLIDKPPTYWGSGPTGVVRDPWRASRAHAGGGVVLMNSIHQLDLVRSMTGLEARRVAALASRRVPGVDVEDAAVAVIEWSDGVIGDLVAAAHAPGANAGETIEIDGEDGAIRLGDPYADRPALDRFVRDSRSAGNPAGRWVPFQSPAVDVWRAAVEAYAAAVAAGRTPVPGIDEAAAALAIVLAIYRSAQTGRFVTVPALTRPPSSARPSGSALSKGAS